jgi:hypothetical protein
LIAELDRNQAYLTKSIRRLNYFEKPVEKLSVNKYKVNHVSLMEYGIFSKVFELFFKYENDRSMMSLPHQKQAEIMKWAIDEFKWVKDIFNYFIQEVKPKKCENNSWLEVIMITKHVQSMAVKIYKVRKVIAKVATKILEDTVRL